VLVNIIKEPIMAKQAASTKTSKQSRASARAHVSDKPHARGDGLIIRNVRIEPGVATKVSFKETSDGKFRVKPYGYPAMFVRMTEKGAEAYVRGYKPVEARTAQKAFAEVLTTQVVKEAHKRNKGR
jgi:hypothetical protein